jgi:hypothetical protein
MQAGQPERFSFFPSGFDHHQREVKARNAREEIQEAEHGAKCNINFQLPTSTSLTVFASDSDSDLGLGWGMEHQLG